jgi:hypothetical protein
MDTGMLTGSVYTICGVLLAFAFGLKLFALSSNGSVITYVDQTFTTYPVLAGAHIYRDALVGLNPAGYLKAFVPGDYFVGMAVKEADNTSGTSGAISCDVRTKGDIRYTLSSVAELDKGKPVFATADDAIALTGHPDAYVGRILAKEATNVATIRLREAGERAPNGFGSQELMLDFSQVLIANQDEGTATLSVGGSGIKTAAVGAGLTAGTTGILMDEANGEVRLLIDNDNEAENLTILTPQVFNITKGITFEFEGRLKTAGGAATDDVDFGLMGLSGGITATQQADMNATTAGLLSALFHLDANANDVFASSDDNASPVAAADTTVDNSLSANAKYKIIVRPTGSAEFYIDGVRVLSTTAFSVGATGLLAGIINLEKSTGTGVPEVRIRKLRVAGAIA